MQGKCYECGKYFESSKDGWYGVHRQVDIYEWIICSSKCLVVFAQDQCDGDAARKDTGGD